MNGTLAFPQTVGLAHPIGIGSAGQQLIYSGGNVIWGNDTVEDSSTIVVDGFDQYGNGVREQWTRVPPNPMPESAERYFQGKGIPRYLWRELFKFMSRRGHVFDVTFVSFPEVPDLGDFTVTWTPDSQNPYENSTALVHRNSNHGSLIYGSQG